jgi:toxin ParE1/3/4
MMRVAFSSTSLQDLLSIATFIALDNPARAESFVQELDEACRGLADQAHHFALIPGLESPEYRRRPYRNYSIIYRIEMDTVRIMRVLNAARDLRRILGD